MSNNFNDKFSNILKNQGKRDIPVNNSSSSKPKKQVHKSVRIYPEDFEKFRTMAFQERKSIIEVISETLEFREKHE